MNKDLTKRNKELLRLYSERTAEFLLEELKQLEFPYNLEFKLETDNKSDVRDMKLKSVVKIIDHTNKIDFSIGINHVEPFKPNSIVIPPSVDDDELIQACIYVNERYSGNYIGWDYLSDEENRRRREEVEQNAPYTYLKRHFQHKWAYSSNIIGDNCYLFCRCAYVLQYAELAKLLALRVQEIMQEFEKERQEGLKQLQNDLLYRLAVKTGDASILLNQ